MDDGIYAGTERIRHLLKMTILPWQAPEWGLTTANGTKQFGKPGLNYFNVAPLNKYFLLEVVSFYNQGVNFMIFRYIVKNERDII